MTDNEIIKIGDICAYFYDNQNKSFSIVEVVEELSDECVVVKFHQVLRDDSGNGFFTYLCDKGKTMNVSRKYLHKIELINRQQTEIERYKYSIKMLEDDVATAKSEAIKEFAKRLKEHTHDIVFYGEIVTVSRIDNLVTEMTEGEKVND